jgi:asparagine synthetase B (glutamine-hydrolysing)
MPGIFGGLGAKAEQYEYLKKSFKSIWGECESLSVKNGFIGGHSFSNDLALHITKGGLHFAVDGEHSLYKNSLKFVQKGKPSLFQLTDGRIEPEVHCKGNVAAVDGDNQTLYLATEWTGSFPIYYTRVDDGILFSSHLRPLSKLIDATADPTGMMQFLKDGFFLAGRTFFKEIRRLMPGQALTYKKVDDHLAIYENSNAWTDWENPIDYDELVKHAWRLFIDTMQRCLKFSRKHGLMASGGWDTRLLLSAYRELNQTKNLICHTHGDLRSREIIITMQILKDLGIHHHLEALSGDMYDLQELKRGFDRVELLFPCFLKAGARLAEVGVECVSAGVIGEVIGGRHGAHWPMLPISEWDKFKFVTPYFLHPRRIHKSINHKDINYFYNLLNLDNIRKPWYLRSEYWDTIPHIREEMHADMEEFVHRLKVRGVVNIDKIFEAYTAEYFGAQMLTPQLLNCRADLNVAIPFADQELFCFTSKIPLSYKILHSLQQSMLRYKEPSLLKYPNSATFLNSKLPIPMLEVFRVMRKMSEIYSWKICRVTHGRFKPKSLAWNNYECLGHSQALQNMADNLKCDMFDKNTIKDGIEMKISHLNTNPSLYPLNAMQSQITTIYNTDLMLQ